MHVYQRLKRTIYLMINGLLQNSKEDLYQTTLLMTHVKNVIAKINYNHTILINNLRCNNHHVIRFLSIISVILIIIDLEYFFKNRL